MMKLAFIGGGNMGEAMLSAILAKKLSTPKDISVGEAREERRQYLKDKYSISAMASNREAVGGKDIVVLAIKPQILAEVMAELKGYLKPHQLVLSIIAGAKISSMKQGLEHNRIVRCMPNTPAQVGAGMSAWTATAEVTEDQKKSAQSILNAMGRELYFNDEKYLDMATAVSGSGPAYFFLLAESLIDAGVNIGLARDAAEVMVGQTMMGAARLLQESGKAPAELRRNVTSPGGTTAAAIQAFESSGFSEIVKGAVAAAHNRAKELGK
jgi:pyrroline-5-carboxylate reductase